MTWQLLTPTLAVANNFLFSQSGDLDRIKPSGNQLLIKTGQGYAENVANNF